MGLFSWLFCKKKAPTKTRSFIYINNTSEPIVFIPYSSEDPSNIRLLANTAKVVRFPGFEFRNFALTDNNLQQAVTGSAAVHVCNDPIEQYYFDVKEQNLYHRKIGGGTLEQVANADKEQVIKLMTNKS